MHNSSQIHSPHNTSASVQSTVFFSLGMVFVGAVSSLVGIGLAWLRNRLNIQQTNQQQLTDRLDAIDGKGPPQTIEPLQDPAIESPTIEYPIELIYHPEADILVAQSPAIEVPLELDPRLCVGLAQIPSIAEDNQPPVPLPKVDYDTVDIGTLNPFYEGDQPPETQTRPDTQTTESTATAPIPLARKVESFTQKD